jgi:hypothetical protein
VREPTEPEPGSDPRPSGGEREPAAPTTAGGHDLIRPFIMTGGRTRAGGDVRLESLVQRMAGPVPVDVPSEQRELLARSTEPISVAELAAQLDLVVSVVAVLVDDLVGAGLVEVHQTDPDDLELGMLTRMVDKIRSL